MFEFQAYFLTWRTYGTWLHGDARGSVDARHNRFGTPLAPASPARESASAAKLAWPPFILTAEARAIVERTITEHCAWRDWRLHAVNARSNHVHVIVDTRSSITPEAAMGQFKAWCTRRLRENGVLAPDRPAWGEHGSTRGLMGDAGFDEAMDYVRNQQD